MSKIDTLISLINYQKQHPEANKSQIAQGIGITPQYLSRCLGEVNLLKEHLSDPFLEADQIRFLVSDLDQGDPYQREIYQHLQGYLSPSPYTGLLRMALPDEKPPPNGLSIGEFIPTNNQSLEHLSPALRFLLDRLCYDSLFWVHRSGAIEWRLATNIEPTDGFSSWIITLRTDLHWSNGKPIIQKDVIQTLANSRLASLIEEITPYDKNRLHIRLVKAEAIFPRRLASLPIRPSHSTRPYRVTSGAYRLKRFYPRANIFRLLRNPDYYQEQRGGIDSIIIKRFKHPARAIKALLRGQIDIIPLDALQPLYQTSNDLPLQQAPFFGEAYYLMLLNRHHGLLQDESNCRWLKEAIDYRGINRYLHGGQDVDEKAMKAPTQSSLNLKIICPGESPTVHYLATFIGKSVGASDINPVFLEESTPQNMREEADVLLSRIFFGAHYSRLFQYFHSQGRSNSFGYANPKVDALLSQLDETRNLNQRRGIGQKVMSILQEDYAIILLSSHFQYLLSPLAIQFDAALTSHPDLIENMKHLVVERADTQHRITRRRKVKKSTVPEDATDVSEDASEQ